MQEYFFGSIVLVLVLEVGEKMKLGTAIFLYLREL